MTETRRRTYRLRLLSLWLRGTPLTALAFAHGLTPAYLETMLRSMLTVSDSRRTAIVRAARRFKQ